jgi:hypothetical protein
VPTRSTITRTWRHPVHRDDTASSAGRGSSIKQNWPALLFTRLGDHGG